MFAILESGNKQYKVQEGDILEVELLDKERITKENSVNFDSVLLVQNEDLHIGQPFVENALITAKVVEEFKAPKIIIFKMKSKKGYKKTQGHRQKLHKIQIEKIEIKAKTKKKTTAKAKPKTTETKKDSTEEKE